MTSCNKILKRNGRTWTLSKVSLKDAENEDFRFWYEGLTPEQSIEAVYDALGASVGKFKKGPRDLATNPKHLEGYGR